MPLIFGDDKMAVYSVIKLSELEGAKRIDAEYYKPEYLELLSRLRKKGCVPVKDVAFPVRRKFKSKKEEYFDYIEISEVDLTTGEFNTSKIIGGEAPDRAQWVVNKDDILVSTVRPIRNAIVLIKEEKENLVCSSGFSILHPKTIQANYLFLYFKMPFIARLLDRHTTATEYPAINWNDVLNTPIYVGSKEFQMKISLMIDKSFALLKQSRSFYSKTENLLLEELGLKDFKPKYKKTYTANLSDVFTAHRIDAEYFQPAYEEILKCMKRNVKIRELKEIATTKRGFLIDPRFYNETEGTPYIRGKDFSSGNLEKSDLVYISRDFQPKNETRVNTGDLVFALIGTVGTSALVTEEFDNSFISNNVGKISIKNKKEIVPEYLAIILNSIVGKLQFEKEASQTAQPKISDLQVRNFKIPFLPLSTQQKIASLVQQSHEARRKAKELLEVAKKAVEIAIENNEKEALGYISKRPSGEFKE